jgi:malate dehydrogenase (oxaloacetate-decarboxylating)(NADP+)
MKFAAAKALASMAKLPVPEEVKKAYPDREFVFGPDYVIPTPFDPRLIEILPVAIA